MKHEMQRTHQQKMGSGAFGEGTAKVGKDDSGKGGTMRCAGSSSLTGGERKKVKAGVLDNGTFPLRASQASSFCPFSGVVER